MKEYCGLDVFAIPSLNLDTIHVTNYSYFKTAQQRHKDVTQNKK